MGVRLVVAVTDGDWFDHLRTRQDLAEVNFWSPSPTPFRALEPGELFLFKLHAPRNFIVGGGVFAYANVLPVSLAWTAFGEANGARTVFDMRARIAKYRRGKGVNSAADFTVGCRILTQPFFFKEADWLPAPRSFALNTVTFKTFNSDEADGRALWDAIQSRIGISAPVDSPRYGQPHLVTPRLGQGAFRVLVTDTYDRRCAITGEKTLPALEAAHILPFTEGGPHEASNGILFRRDIHSLFDAGYVTVTPDLRFEVSRRIKEEFENGRAYYALHGQELAKARASEGRPDPAKLAWHNANRFLG